MNDIANLELIPADTTSEAFLFNIAVWRRMSADRRLEMAFRMTESLREVIASGVRKRHPEYNEREIKLAVIRLTLGEELFGKVYPGVEIKP